MRSGQKSQLLQNGIAFDGKGYGTDGTIWGSEFLFCTVNDFQRHAILNILVCQEDKRQLKNAQGMKPLIHINITSNDAYISLGQAYIVGKRLKN